MALKFDPANEGGLRGSAWRAFCRAIEVPGEYTLPDVMRRARAASGCVDPESQWALRQYEALRQHLEHEKQSLTQLFAFSLLLFFGLSALAQRDTANRRLSLLAPLNGALALGFGLRIWMVNALLRRFWERTADEE